MLGFLHRNAGLHSGTILSFHLYFDRKHYCTNFSIHEIKRDTFVNMHSIPCEILLTSSYWNNFTINWKYLTAFQERWWSSPETIHCMRKSNLNYSQQQCSNKFFLAEESVLSSYLIFGSDPLSAQWKRNPLNPWIKKWILVWFYHDLSYIKIFFVSFNHIYRSVN